MSERVYIMPGWLRAWHWLNAICFLLLIASGFSLHFASPQSTILIPFETARIIHNVSGITITVLYGLYLVFTFATGNFRQYLPPLRGLIPELNAQNAYVAFGIFKGERPPLVPSPERKFNALQQMTYLLVMFVAMPVIIASGLLFMFPEAVPERLLGLPGLLPVAMIHYVMGFLLALFLLGHVYMGTMGTTAWAGFRMMITGWHVESEVEAHGGSTTPQGQYQQRRKR
jgi:thiosulfate reductase cytochrome b subunit